MRTLNSILISCIYLNLISIASGNQDETASYWVSRGRKEIFSRISATDILRQKADNVVLLVGNLAQRRSDRLNDILQNFTFCGQIHNSSDDITLTTILSGVRTQRGTVGLTDAVLHGQCDTSQQEDYRLTNLRQWAQNAGLVTGFITTQGVTDRSVSALYAYAANDKWNRFSGVGCTDIAQQLIDKLQEDEFKVAVGTDEEPFLPSQRPDRKHLTRDLKENSTIFRTRNDFINADTSRLDRIFALFKPEETPTLVQMYGKSMELLKHQNKRYFLFVDGSNSSSASDQFEEVIKLAVESTNFEQTLMVVLAGGTSNSASLCSMGRNSAIFNTTTVADTFIAHGIGVSACIGPHRDVCAKSGATAAIMAISYLTAGLSAALTILTESYIRLLK